MAIHAAGESSPGRLPPHTHAIALAARNSAHLTEIAKKLDERKLGYVLIHEDCAPYAGALLAIGVVPGPRSVLKRALSSLPLLRHPQSSKARQTPSPSVQPYQPPPSSPKKLSWWARLIGG